MCCFDEIKKCAEFFDFHRYNKQWSRFFYFMSAMYIFGLMLGFVTDATVIPVFLVLFVYLWLVEVEIYEKMYGDDLTQKETIILKHFNDGKVRLMEGGGWMENFIIYSRNRHGLLSLFFPTAYNPIDRSERIGILFLVAAATMLYQTIIKWYWLADTSTSWEFWILLVVVPILALITDKILVYIAKREDKALTDFIMKNLERGIDNPEWSPEGIEIRNRDTKHMVAKRNSRALLTLSRTDIRIVNKFFHVMVVMGFMFMMYAGAGGFSGGWFANWLLSSLYWFGLHVFKFSFHYFREDYDMDFKEGPKLQLKFQYKHAYSKCDSVEHKYHDPSTYGVNYITHNINAAKYSVNLPEGFVARIDEHNKPYWINYSNTHHPVTTREDPRTMPDGWTKERGDNGWYWIHNRSGTKSWKDPRLLPEYNVLLAGGEPIIDNNFEEELFRGEYIIDDDNDGDNVVELQLKNTISELQEGFQTMNSRMEKLVAREERMKRLESVSEKEGNRKTQISTNDVNKKGKVKVCGIWFEAILYPNESGGYDATVEDTEEAASLDCVGLKISNVKEDKYIIVPASREKKGKIKMCGIWFDAMFYPNENGGYDGVIDDTPQASAAECVGMRISDVDDDKMTFSEDEGAEPDKLQLPKSDQKEGKKEETTITIDVEENGSIDVEEIGSKDVYDENVGSAGGTPETSPEKPIEIDVENNNEVPVEKNNQINDAEEKQLWKDLNHVYECILKVLREKLGKAPQITINILWNEVIIDFHTEDKTIKSLDELHIELDKIGAANFKQNLETEIQKASEPAMSENIVHFNMEKKWTIELREEGSDDMPSVHEMNDLAPAEVHGIVNQWASRQCCYGRGSGTNIEVISAVGSCTRKLTLETWSETRWLEDKIEPYEGKWKNGYVNPKCPRDLINPYSSSSNTFEKIETTTIKKLFQTRPFGIKIKSRGECNAFLYAVDDDNLNDLIGTQIWFIGTYDCLEMKFNDIRKLLHNIELPVEISFLKPKQAVPALPENTNYPIADHDPLWYVGDMNDIDIIKIFKERPLGLHVEVVENGCNAIVIKVDDEEEHRDLIGLQISCIKGHNCLKMSFNAIVKLLHTEELPLDIAFRKQQKPSKVTAWKESLVAKAIPYTERVEQCSNCGGTGKMDAAHTCVVFAVCFWCVYSDAPDCDNCKRRGKTKQSYECVAYTGLRKQSKCLDVSNCPLFIVAARPGKIVESGEVDRFTNGGLRALSSMCKDELLKDDLDTFIYRHSEIEAKNNSTIACRINKQKFYIEEIPIWEVKYVMKSSSKNCCSYIYSKLKGEDTDDETPKVFYIIGTDREVYWPSREYSSKCLRCFNLLDCNAIGKMNKEKYDSEKARLLEPKQTIEEKSGRYGITKSKSFTQFKNKSKLMMPICAILIVFAGFAIGFFYVIFMYMDVDLVLLFLVVMLPSFYVLIVCLRCVVKSTFAFTWS